MYDAVIVGGRCAGAATALLLARKGYHVLVLDRAAFPSDTISGHCILHRGTVRLKRWGLLEEVLESNCPPITSLASDWGDFTLTAEVPTPDDAPAAIAPRRIVLDSLLLDAAARAGAEIRQEFVVDGLLWEGERVTGIRGRSKSGTRSQEFGRVVIGADGKHSRVAQWAQAPVYEEVPSLSFWYMSYWSDYPCDKLEMYWRPGRMLITLPTNDGLVLQAVAWTRTEFQDFRRDIEGNFMRTLMMMPDAAARVPDARRVTPFVGTPDVPSFFRRPYGAGWALVGDAGHHKDPLPAYGISDAFCDAELLAEALDSVFADATPMHDALSLYEQRRNERALPDHRQTCERAALIAWDTPQALGLRAALRHNPVEAGRYLAVMAKALPAEQFFNPQNLSRIMQMAQPHS